MSPQSAGEIAVALGLALKPQAKDEGSSVGYVKMIAPAGIDRLAVDAIEMQSAEVHLEFERDLAARLAGRSVPDTRKAVLVGAGALGSHLADCLVREGRFRWTVIDDDRVLPHNLARHIARNDQVTRPKATVLADCLNTTLAGEGDLAKAVPANLFAGGEHGATVETPLNGADLIIDATASVLAGRALSDHEAQARRVSVFFNPAGEAVVLLAEPAGRALTLRDLEAQYLGLVLRTARLADHLGKDAETVAYTGACRAITNRIPQSRVSVLAGLAASGLSRAVDGTAPVISVWSLASSGEVTLDFARPEPVSRYRALDWLITIDAGVAARIRAMRGARLPAETGGVLSGLVDIPAKSIHLVDASPAPPGGEEWPDGFVRGMQGLEDSIESVRRRTAGQVRYVGEWHSHPPRASAHPSAVDARQIDWLAALMGMDSMPALMLIAADEKMGVIFAHQRAELLPPERAA